MRRICLITIPLVLSWVAPTFADQAHDYPGLGHIQGYRLDLYWYAERSFDRVTLEGDPGQKIPVEGHTYRLQYDAENSSSHASNLEIYLNYLSLLKSLKAEVLYSPADINKDDEHLLARLYRNGTPTYVYISAEGNGNVYKMFIIEQRQFQPSIVTSPSQ